jgi:hypothetical protein
MTQALAFLYNPHRFMAFSACSSPPTTMSSLTSTCWVRPEMLRRAVLALTLLAAPALARDSLGMFGTWGAFSDARAPGGPRCYAIAMAAPSTLQRDYQPYATIGTWPRAQVRGQVHFRLSRKLQPNTPITLIMSGQRYQLVGGGGDAWAADKRMDAAIVAAMRSAGEMTVSARGADGRGFTNTWSLDGAATAMDAAAVGCARLR